MTAAPQQPGSGDKPARSTYSAVFLFALAVILAVTGLFWINHDVHVTEAAVQRQAQAQARDQQAAARRQQQEQEAAQARQSLGICAALVGLDDARIGAEFASASHTGVPLSKSYGYRLSKHIHDVVKATHCAALLAGKLPAH